jgi:hypothetical protein
MQLSPLGKITLAAACGASPRGESLRQSLGDRDLLPPEKYALALEVLKVAISQSGDAFFLRACRILGRHIQRAQASGM